jgi:uncharacterized protein YecT (DUF1311 family)
MRPIAIAVTLCHLVAVRSWTQEAPCAERATPSERVACFESRARSLDSALGRTWQRLLAHPRLNARQQSLLRGAHQAWLQWRQLEVDAVRAALGSAPGFEDLSVVVQINLTEGRLEYLIAVLGELNETMVPPEVRAGMAAMRADLRNLIVAQESYFADSTTYATRLPPDYVASSGVRVTLLAASGLGWNAVATHERAPGNVCGVFVGDRAPLRAAMREGEPLCWRAATAADTPAVGVPAAESLLARGDSALARQRAEAVLSDAPDAARARLVVARIEAADAAVEQIERLLEPVLAEPLLRPAAAAVYLQAGLRFYRDSGWAPAERLLASARRHAEGAALRTAAFFLGMARVQLGVLADAEAERERDCDAARRSARLWDAAEPDIREGAEQNREAAASLLNTVLPAYRQRAAALVRLHCS